MYIKCGAILDLLCCTGWSKEHISVRCSKYQASNSCSLDFEQKGILFNSFIASAEWYGFMK